MFLHGCRELYQLNVKSIGRSVCSHKEEEIFVCSTGGWLLILILLLALGYLYLYLHLQSQLHLLAFQPLNYELSSVESGDYLGFFNFQMFNLNLKGNMEKISTLLSF